ncbi:hypothetical protein BGZ76_003024 [Entomortierella beljakovae]|nr:hypothetical protein BGZ76_003024 [Entomortierella beljakovae]
MPDPVTFPLVPRKKASKLNPLYIPEIQFRIAKYIEQEDLVRCMLVCRAWYELILPEIWKRVIVISSELHILPYGFTPRILKKYRLLIQELGIHDNRPGRYASSYKNLRNLDLGPGNPANHAFVSEGDPTQIITANSSIESLNINRLDHYLLAPFWNSIANLPYLNTLMMRDSVISSELDSTAFWQSCQNLESLCLTYTALSLNHDVLLQLSFQRMKSLEFDLIQSINDETQLGLIRQCPNLESLSWYVRDHKHAIGTFAKDVSQGFWPNMETISLAYDIDDEYLTEIIGSMRRITTLNMSRNDFGESSFKALRVHFSTLTKISLWACPEVTSSMLQEILCSCPLLEDLKGNTILARDIVGGGAWVCHSMRALEICFSFNKNEQDFQPKVFERLSQFNLLEKFSIGGMIFWRKKLPLEALDLRLESGLGKLVHLKNLKSVNCYNTTQAMKETDILWMVENWKNLSKLSGELNQDQKTKSSLHALLRSHGVNAE